MIESDGFDHQVLMRRRGRQSNFLIAMMKTPPVQILESRI